MKRYWLGLTLTLAGGGVWAETAYVTDELRLGLHQLQDTSDRPFDVLVSGTQLEVLERLSNYARVRTPDGQIGWVKAAYLVEQPPARHRLAELESRIAGLTAELDAVRERSSGSTSQLTELQSQLAASSARVASLEGLEIRNEELRSELQSYGGSIRWPFALAGALLALGAGVLAGRAWVERQIRKRFGGLRVF